METKYYPARTYMAVATCEKCKGRLDFVKADYSKLNQLCWLHKCANCGKKYWLDNRYPTTIYAYDFDAESVNITNVPSTKIEFEEANDTENETIVNPV